MRLSQDERWKIIRDAQTTSKSLRQVGITEAANAIDELVTLVMDEEAYYSFENFAHLRGIYEKAVANLAAAREGST